MRKIAKIFLLTASIGVLVFGVLASRICSFGNTRSDASADAAIDWATGQEWDRDVTVGDGHIAYRPSAAPAEIVRRIVTRAVTGLAHEGSAEAVRGRELEPVIAALEAGRTATLRGVLCTGGKEWRFSQAPARKTGL